MKRFCKVLVIAALLILGISVAGPTHSTYADIPALEICDAGLSKNCTNIPKEPCGDNKHTAGANCLQRKQCSNWLSEATICSVNSYNYSAIFKKFFLLNLGVELFAAVIILLFMNRFSKRLFVTVAVINIISWPIFYFATLKFSTLLVLAAGEIAVIALEALAIYFLNKKQVSGKFAILLSLTLNILTIVCGILIALVPLF